MSYVLSDGANTVITYPYTDALLKQDNPSTSFSNPLTDVQRADRNMFPVVELPQPVYDPTTQRIELQAAPVNNGGTWEIDWDTIALTAQEQQNYADKLAIQAFESGVDAEIGTLSENEKFAILAMYNEVKRFRGDIAAGATAGALDAPLIDAYRAVTGETRLQAATAIETRAEAKLTNLVTAFANKVQAGL